MRRESILETVTAPRGEGRGGLPLLWATSLSLPCPSSRPCASVSVTHRPARPSRGSHGSSAGLDSFPCWQVGAFFREGVPWGGLAG